MTPHRLRSLALLLTLIGVEAVWLSLWSFVLGPPPDGGAVHWLPLFLAGAAMVLWNQRFWRRTRPIVSLLGGFLIITVLMALVAPVDAGVLGLPAWWQAVVGIWHYLAVPVPFTIIAVAGIALWVRTVRMAQESPSLFVVVGILRRSVISALAAVGFAVIRGVALPPSQVFIFCAFALASLALSRADDLSQLPAAGRLPFNRRWLGNLGGGIALALALGLVATLIFSTRGMALLAELFRPVILLAATLYAWVLVAFASLFIPVIENLYANVPPTPTAVPVTPMPLAPTPVQEFGTGGVPYNNSLLLLVMVGGALLLLYLAYRLLLRAPARADDEEVPEGAQADYGRVPIQWNPSDWLRRQTAALSDRFRRGPRPEFGIDTVRDLYKNLLLFGDEHGLARPVEQTPYEYLQPLTQWYPRRRDDFRALTDAYVATHYGERDFPRAEVERLQAAWRRIVDEPPPRTNEEEAAL